MSSEAEICLFLFNLIPESTLRLSLNMYLSLFGSSELSLKIYPVSTHVRKAENNLCLQL
jgi:hypothetical protein